MKERVQKMNGRKSMKPGRSDQDSKCQGNKYQGNQYSGSKYEFTVKASE